MDKEDGEMSDDNTMQIDEVKMEKDSDCTLLYKAEKNGLVIKKLEKVDAAKLEERAKRFGLNFTGNRAVTQKQIDELYANCGIESGNERHFRFDTLSLHGVDGLSTKEIFNYLEDYKPLSLEWIDDTSCNIVCQDHISAALALLMHSREIKNEDLKSMLSGRYHWREGVPHPKKDLILMRFATNGDKKMTKKQSDKTHMGEYCDHAMHSISKNPWGDLCRNWGVYDHQEVFIHKYSKYDYEDEIEEPEKPVQIRNKRLAMRLGKRRNDPDQPDEDNDESNSDSEWKKRSKVPRMRMHADDEETKQRIKERHTSKSSRDSIKSTYAPLSIEVVNSQSTYTPRESTKLSEKFKYHNVNEKKHSIQSRLGKKVRSVDNSSSDEISSENSDHNIMSKVQKINNATKGTSSVWSRLEKKSSNVADRSDLRQVLKSKQHKKSDDLRERLGKAKRSNLRIEIENNYSSDSDS